MLDLLGKFQVKYSLHSAEEFSHSAEWEAQP